MNTSGTASDVSGVYPEERSLVSHAMILTLRLGSEQVSLKVLVGVSKAMRWKPSAGAEKPPVRPRLSPVAARCR